MSPPASSNRAVAMDSGRERVLGAVVAAGLSYGLCSMYRKTASEIFAYWMRRLNVSGIEKARIKVYGEAAKYPALNQKLLADILEQHQGTAFGKERGIVGLSAEDFRSSFPLTDFEDYMEAIERMKKGEEAVMFPGKPKVFATSSGTTGASKYIPMNGGMVQTARDMFAFTFSGPVAMIPGTLHPITHRRTRTTKHALTHIAHKSHAQKLSTR